MKFILILAVLYLSLTAIRSYSQNAVPLNDHPGKNLITLSFSAGDIHVKDEYASPLIYRVPGIGIFSSYTRSDDKDRHFVELAAYYARLKPVYDVYYAYNFRFSVRYNFIRRVLTFGGDDSRFRIGIGGGLYSFCNLSFYMENEFEYQVRADVVCTWYLAHSAELTALVEYDRKTRDHFELQLQLPVVSSVSRPTYSYVPSTYTGYDFIPFGALTPFWKNFIAQFKFAYRHMLSSGFGLSAQYDFQYSSYNEPRDIRLYMNNIRAGVYFCF